jgi:hypothetical protein
MWRKKVKEVNKHKQNGERKLNLTKFRKKQLISHKKDRLPKG